MEIIFELSRKGRQGFILRKNEVSGRVEDFIDPSYLRESSPDLPEVSEPEVVRHFVNLSSMNHHVDKDFYPLGSCTMKYNPKINEDMASLEGFTSIHPYQDEDTVQGALQLMWELEEYLKEIAGFDAVTLQPSAGAQGELTGLLIIRKYHETRGNPRKKVLIPDSAHGTNPASVSMAGYTAVSVPSDSTGRIDIDKLMELVDEDVACLMVTNPNTLGLFEYRIKEIADIIHEKGGLMYMDGANLNALLGIVRPGDIGIDVMHFNLHKTFSTPHGGGGPGAGPVGVKDFLKDFLPVPVVKKDGDKFYLDYSLKNSIGKVQTFYGNFLVMVRAYTYIRIMGGKGLKEVSRGAIINANYLMENLKDIFELPYPGPCMHEFVLSGEKFKKFGIRTLDIAKRMLDYGIHAPTIYFPLIVKEALMIEPTETESRRTLDRVIEIMKSIVKEAEENPEILKKAPHNTPVRRLNEAKAARSLNVCY